MSTETLEYIKETVTRIEMKLDSHDTRIRSVENWQSNANGKITAFGIAGVLVGGAVTYLTDLFKS